jgi:hypothetical protein
MARNQSRWIGGLLIGIALAAAGCGSARGTVTTTSTSSTESSLPPGVMTAAQACKQVVEKSGRGFFTGVEEVHLVLTSYAKGEPVESQGDISSGMPPETMVWVVEVHAKAINWDHSVPSNYKAPAQPDTDFSVVMNARTGYVSDAGECTCWPLPLSKVGAVVSLPPEC